ncbi:hypothetical protein D3C78_1359380 [compost metagenome]
MIALAGVDGVVHPPWAVHLAVIDVLLTTVGLELFDDLLHVLHLLLVRHQNSILGLNDHQILDAHGRHQAVFRMHISVARTLAKYVALEHIALSILGADVPKRRP